MKVSQSICSIILVAATVEAFTPGAFPNTKRVGETVTELSMAGFGGGGAAKGMGGKKKKGAKKVAPVLKPKAQWDRYGSLKKSTPFRVATRVANDGEDVSEWFEVGKIKSEDDATTEAAVALQRGLIAEHAKRLYPLNFLQKDKVDWAYAEVQAPEQEDWIQVDKSSAADAEAGLEKKVGFEGKPDAATGFYCHYQDGRLVDKYDEGKAMSK